jgi:streptogramin lyase
VRQILGRPGEVWLPESGADKLVVIREKVFGQYLGSE